MLCRLKHILTIIMMVVLVRVAFAEDIRELNQHFNEPDGSFSPWMFIPEDNVKAVSTKNIPGLLTVWPGDKGKDIKGVLEKPIGINDYALPWEFKLGLVQNYNASLLGVGEPGQHNYAIGLNLAVTFSDPATWPKDRSKQPPDTHSFQLFVVHLGNTGEWSGGLPQFAPYYHPENFLVWGRGDLAPTLNGDWKIPYVHSGPMPNSGPASPQDLFRVVVLNPTTIGIGIKFHPWDDYDFRTFNCSAFGKMTGIWEMGPIMSGDRWIPDELCPQLPVLKPEIKDPPEPIAPSPDYALHVDYGTFMYGYPVAPLEHYSDDFNIPGYLGQCRGFQMPLMAETWTHPGNLTVTLLGPSQGCWFGPQTLLEIDLNLYQPPFEIETCFTAPDDSVPWTVFINQVILDKENVRRGYWFPGVQNSPKIKRHRYINYYNKNKDALLHKVGEHVKKKHPHAPWPESVIKVAFDPEVPQAILSAKPLYMLYQVIDPSHVRIGFRAKPEDLWYLSKVFDCSEVSHGGIGKIGTFCFGMVAGSDWGVEPGSPMYQQYLFDYIHYRYGLSTNIIDKDKMKPRGAWIKATVPDTLDLAQRAELSINVLTRNMNPDQAYSVYQAFTYNTKPPTQAGITWNLTSKNARALPKLRTMCGSEQNLEIEAALMQAILNQINDDGQVYFPVSGEGVPQDTSNPLINGLIVLAMVNWYERDSNPAWLELIEHLARGLTSISIAAEDRSYYPLESGYKPDGSWHWTQREGKPPIPYTPPDEPLSDQQGLEGCAKFHHAGPLRALLRSYRLNNDIKSLETAQRIARFMLKPGMWEDTSADGYPGYQHGIFGGHFHGSITPLYALLDLAVAEKNGALKQLVREGYDHALRTGVISMGWFPSWANPENYARPTSLLETSEACGVSDVLLLAVKLTDAGLGDYWDDVDAIVRNHLAGQQIIDLDRMRKIAAIEAGGEGDEMLQRYVGGFCTGAPTSVTPNVWGCCSANGAIGLYYAWHGITRFDKGVATVNLLLNRASAWMDIDSYLPYEGKVVLHNKKAYTAQVRIPSWVPIDQVTCTLNAQTVQPPRVGRHLLFQNLKENDKIILEFCVPEFTQTYTMAGKDYTLTLRGSTLVDIAPRDTRPGQYPFCQRDALRAGKAPMKAIKRFVADKILPLQ